MEEKAKYEGIYADQARYPRYGHSNHGARSKALLKAWKPSSLLDVGCGWNEYVREFKKENPTIRAIGSDFACPGADVRACLTALPFQDKEFDVLTAFDVLEHLRPEQVDTVLLQMNRVSSRFILSISYVDSVNRWKGQTLHPTVRSEEWWMRKLMKAGAIAVSKWGNYITGTWDRPLVLKPATSVVLVGNGPSVLTSKLGGFIDSFDEVVRFNNYRTEGFEAHVGRKTTLWSTYFLGNERDDKHSRVLCNHERRQTPPSATEVYRIPSKFFDKTRQFVQEHARLSYGFREDTAKLLASSGLTVTQYFLDILEADKVHLAGFDHFSKRNSGQHHYWIPSTYGRPKEHDGDLEAELFDKLRRAGRVVYLT